MKLILNKIILQIHIKYIKRHKIKAGMSHEWTSKTWIRIKRNLNNRVRNFIIIKKLINSNKLVWIGLHIF